MAALNISTRQLRAFVALAELKNFTRAADQCGLSQPAFSAVIQGIEAAAGARLFDRSTRHVELTPEGRLLEQWSRRLLADFETAFANIHDHITLQKGRVGIAALPTIAFRLLPPIITAYHAAYPGVAIEIFDTLSRESLDLVRQGRADLAVTAADLDGDSDFIAEPLFKERFHLVCRRDSPLARRKKLRLADLASEPFIHMVKSSSIRSKIDACLDDLRLNVVMEVTHLATVSAMVEAGLGISILPAFGLQRLNENMLMMRPIEDKRLFRTISLVRAKGRGLSAAADTMYEALRTGIGVRAKDPAAIMSSRL